MSQDEYPVFVYLDDPAEKVQIGVARNFAQFNEPFNWGIELMTELVIEDDGDRVIRVVSVDDIPSLEI